MSIPSELKPVKLLRVIDLVQSAGVDVSSWADYKNGKKSPGANPKYCYEWAFIQPGKLIVLNLWFERMVIADGQVEQYFSLHGNAARQETNGARKIRRQRMEEAIELAYREGLPVRVVVLSANKPATTSKKLKVTARILDPVPWAVIAHSEKNGIILRRGEPPRIATAISEARYQQAVLENAVPTGTKSKSKYEEPEGGLPVPPKNGASGASGYKRNPSVAAHALEVVDFKCEIDPTHITFVSNAKSLPYVEAHHLVPMSKQGEYRVSLDIAANVVALCPLCHRLLHHGKSADKMSFLKKLFIKRNSRLKEKEIRLSEKTLLGYYSGDLLEGED